MSALFSPRNWFFLWVSFSYVKAEDLARRLVKLALSESPEQVPASGSWNEPSWAEVLVQFIGWILLIPTVGLALAIVVGTPVTLILGIPLGFTPAWLNWMLIPCGISYLFWFCVVYSTIERLHDHVKKVKRY